MSREGKERDRLPDTRSVLVLITPDGSSIAGQTQVLSRHVSRRNRLHRQ